jgi:uncharacterized protein with GYD domain
VVAKNFMHFIGESNRSANMAWCILETVNSETVTALRLSVGTLGNVRIETLPAFDNGRDGSDSEKGCPLKKDSPGRG